MTGQGQARVTTSNAADGSSSAPQERYEVEIRSVNHRGLKIIVRCSDTLAGWESTIENRIRKQIHRGSLTVTAKRSRLGQGDLPSINQDALQYYCDQLQSISTNNTDHNVVIDLSRLVMLPGVMASESRGDMEDAEKESIAKAVTETVDQAIEDFQKMRSAEGSAMVDTIVAEMDGIQQRVHVIAEKAPQVAQRYAQRLSERIDKVIADRGIAAEPVDLIREVQIYADRTDVSEEISRLQSHLVRLRETVETPSDSQVGRKLDFIVQEMFRESNTIGSKSADDEMSAEVVEIKCAMERIREMVQNVE